MKICIPTSTNNGKDAKGHEHFGSAPYFTIYDTEKDCVEVIDNSNQHHSHGTCQPMNVLINRDIDAVVCSGLGARAIQKLNESGIAVYRAEPGTAADIAAQFVKGGLEKITVEDACNRHDCR